MNKNIFAPALPVLLFGAGLYFIIRLRGFFIFHPFKVMKVFAKKSESDGTSISPFKALSVALAGTLGVGNIVGVASAIILGGPGAVFWLWASAIAAMAIKYAEIVLAMQNRVYENGHFHGGAMYYIKSPAVASLFAFFCITASLTLGNLIQIKAAADALEGVFSIQPIICGIVAAILIFAVVAGGVKSIANFTVKLIPFLTIVYILLSSYVMIKNSAALPSVMGLIFENAFDFSSPSHITNPAAGGVAGYAILGAIRYGVSRGLLSNEAGCGTAPIAHAHSNTKSPVEQGFWGILEVFADTIVLCTMTAFVILISYDQLMHLVDNNMMYVIEAYRLHIGDSAAVIIGISICLFALATMICWAHYGLEGLYFLSKNKVNRSVFTAFTVIYCIAAIVGSVITAEFAWGLADFAAGAMTVLNTIYLCGSGESVVQVTRLYFASGKVTPALCIQGKKAASR